MWLYLLLALALVIFLNRSQETFATSHGTVMQMNAKGHQDFALTDGRYVPLDSIDTSVTRIPSDYVGWYPTKPDYRRSGKKQRTFLYLTFPQLVGTKAYYAKQNLHREHPDLNVEERPVSTSGEHTHFRPGRVILYVDNQKRVMNVPRIG